MATCLECGGGLPNHHPRCDTPAVEAARLQAQPPPTGNGPEVLPLVIADLTARAEHGRQKYGTTLRAHNGRSALRDAKEEAADQLMYLTQLEMEWPQLLDQVRRDALEEAALAAEADLGELPPGPWCQHGLVEERQRCDAGASAQAARRIAARIRELQNQPPPAPKGGA